MLFAPEVRARPPAQSPHERHSRPPVRPRGGAAFAYAAGPIAETIARVLGPLPPALRQTGTFDNGTEFARHHELHDLGIKTFFCGTPTHRGRRGESRTPSAGCVASCPGR